MVWLWLSIARETQKLTRYQNKEFSYILNFSLQNKRKFLLVQLARRYSFTARNWSLVFDPKKLTFCISSEHKTTYKSPGSYSLPLLWKICKRISPFDPATWQHPRESPRHVRGSARIYDVRMAQFVLKTEKLSHIIGARGSQDLRSPSPVMAPGLTQFLVSKWAFVSRFMKTVLTYGSHIVFWSLFLNSSNHRKRMEYRNWEAAMHIPYFSCIRAISRILLIYERKWCNLIGLAIEHYQPLY